MVSPSADQTYLTRFASDDYFVNANWSRSSHVILYDLGNWESNLDR